MRVPVSIRTSYFMADKKALVDSGATDNFMHPAFAKRMGLGLQELPTPKKIFNIDNTSNKSGMITHFLDLNVQTNGVNKEMRFLVTDIGHVTFFLLTTVHITDYHWDRHSYFVIHSHHAQTMTHTPPSDDSLLVLILVVLVACDSD
jgi:hypothetical protein